MKNPAVVVVAASLLACLASSALAERQEIVIKAAELAAPDQRSDSPETGKWWLKRDAQAWGVADGTILLSGQPSEEKLERGMWSVIPLSQFVPYRVPKLVVDPKVTGWYRLHVGVYTDEVDDWAQPMIEAKLSTEPYGELLRGPRPSKSKVVEVYWKAADLTGKQVEFAQPKAPMPHTGAGWLSGITHLRLVPMSAEEVAQQKQQIELPPLERRMFAMLDTTDDIYWFGTAENEDDIQAIVYQHQQAGFGRVYWRCYGTYLDNSLAVPEAAPRWSADDEKRYCAKEKCAVGWMAYIDLSRRFDPLKVAVDYGRAIGCDVHAMVRFTNHNRRPYSNFWHDHPEFYAQRLKSDKKDAKGEPIPNVPYERVPYERILSFAYPEVRTYYVKFFKQLASTGTRGIMIDLLRHPPIAGYEPIVTDAFKQKYGRAMETLDIYHDPLVQEHLSQYFHAFLVEMRQAIGNDIEISVRCSGPNNYALRGKEWIEAGLIDTIVDGHWYSGNGPRPTIDETVAAVGTRGKAMAVAEVSDVDPNKNWQRREGNLSPEAILALAKAYSGRGVASFGVYESTVHVRAPEARRAIRAAGWSFEPRKMAK